MNYPFSVCSVGLEWLGMALNRRKCPLFRLKPLQENFLYNGITRRKTVDRFHLRVREFKSGFKIIIMRCHNVI